MKDVRTRNGVGGKVGGREGGREGGKEGGREEGREEKDRVAQGWVGPSRCLMDQVLREALGSGLALEQSSWLTRYGQHGTGGVGIVCLCGKGLRRLLKWHMSRLCLCEGGIAEQTN